MKAAGAPSTTFHWLALAACAAALSCGSDAGPSPQPTPTPQAVCGNGRLESGEECDDANAANGDGCLVTCQRPASWVSSDVHAHTTGCSRSFTPEAVALQFKAQGIQVAASLVWGTGFDDDAPLFTGKDHPLSTPGFILHYDLEVSHFPAATTGHLLLLGLDSLRFSENIFDTPSSGLPVADWARRQPRAVVGMAHGEYWPADGSFPVPPGGCCVPWEVVVQASRGTLGFLSVERMPMDRAGAGAFRLWKALLNAGFRVGISGGSDWGCLTHVFGDDTPRTDVIVDGPLTYESWLLGLKAGRTTVASGPNRLNLRVDGRRLGEELSLAAPQEVGVALETDGPAATDVDVLVNGEVVQRVTPAAGFQLTQLRVPVPRSSWIAARSRSVLTSAVYVVVGGQPIRASAADACYLRRSVEDLAWLVTSNRLRLTQGRDEALRAYGDAVAELQRRFTESGGQDCR